MKYKMRIFFITFIILLSLSNVCFGMYGEDNEPSTYDSNYTRDKESPSSITTPEIETTMPESLNIIRGDENDPKDEDCVEKNLEDKEGFGNMYE